MNIQQTTRLYEAFPLLYRMHNQPMNQTAMCWGFECGPGWFDLIWKLSEQLEKLIAEMSEEDRLYVCASQVKEKYGELCFYMHSATDEMYKLINEAERESAHICESCGAPGKTRGHGWYYTACGEHTEENDKE